VPKPPRYYDKFMFINNKTKEMETLFVQTYQSLFSKIQLQIKKKWKNKKRRT
jgi:hypothetical protein